jgi:hypothetical protein
VRTGVEVAINFELPINAVEYQGRLKQKTRPISTLERDPESSCERKTNAV